jgi:hypothetical protein
LVLLVLALEDDVCVVDPDVVWQLIILLEHTGLIGCVLQDHIRLLVLVLTETHQHDISLGYPHLLPHLATNMTEALNAIDTLRFEAAVTQHSNDLGVLLPILLVNKLTLLLLILVLSSLPVLASLSLVLWHFYTNSAVCYLVTVLARRPAVCIYSLRPAPTLR